MVRCESGPQLNNSPALAFPLSARNPLSKTSRPSNASGVEAARIVHSNGMKLAKAFTSGYPSVSHAWRVSRSKYYGLKETSAVKSNEFPQS